MRLKLYSLLSLLFLVGTAPARADITINAQVDKTAVALNDQIMLEVTVSGNQASLPDPQMPPLPNFSVYSSGRNQSISFVNGSIASSIVHTYVLVPHFVGKGVIEPITLTYQGQTAKTQPIEIRVQPPASGGAPRPPASAPRGGTQGSGGGRGAPDLFVTAELDKKKAFVNEQATLSIKFYTSVTLLGNPQYTAPKISGFIAEDLPPERHGNVVMHGRTYYYSEIRTALFPAQAGKLAVGAATVRCQVQRDVAVDPFAPDFFQRFFSQGAVGQPRDISSDPLLLLAEPLPEAGKPAHFTGAVGRYSVTAAVDRAKVKVGEAVNLTVTVQGTGNLQTIGEPKMPELPSFRVYDTVSSMNLDKKEGVVRGSKVFKTVLVPRVSGSLDVPAIAFAYFDPGKGYVNASTLPIALAVAPGEAGQAAADPAPGAPASRGLTAVNEDIRYLKTRMSSPVFSRALAAVAGAGPAHGLPFLAFAWALALNFYRGRAAADGKGTRFRRALKSAAARVKSASRADDHQRAVALLSDALSHYIADKLDLPASGLTLRRVQELLKSTQPHLTQRRLDQVRELWEELDLLRFAPSAAGSHRKNGALPADVLELLKGLDKEMKKR